MPDPLLEDSAAAEENLDEGDLQADVSRRTVEESRETTTKVYELVYEDDRWNLAKEISAVEDEVAKYLFQYALKE